MTATKRRRTHSNSGAADERDRDAAPSQLVRPVRVERHAEEAAARASAPRSSCRW